MTVARVLELGELRERLPLARSALAFGFTHTTPSGQRFNFTGRIGFYPDGRVGEVFVDGEKLASQTDVEAHDAAILLSFALQFGATLDEIGPALLRAADGHPEGVMGTLVDAIQHATRAAP